MRIVIDLQGVQTESRSRGIGSYSMSLAKALALNSGEHEIIIVLNGLFPETIEPIRSAFAGLLPPQNICVWYAPEPVRGCDPDNEWRYKTAELIREAFLISLNPEIVHISSLFEGFSDEAVTSIGHLDHNFPVSVTLFDLIPLINPELYLKPNPSYEQFYHRKIEHLCRASLLLSISESSREEGIKYLPQKKTVITNISAAANACFVPKLLSDEEEKYIRKKFGLNRSFILYVGGTDERKNLTRLIRAYSQLDLTLQKKYQLVFVGALSISQQKALENEATKVALGDSDFCCTGYVSIEEMVQFYNLCTLLVLPSWHEGFGLPALEAMSCGTAVIGACTTSLPEVIGNPEALFDPFSEKAIADKITQVLCNEDFRQDLIESGLKQAKHFSWNKCSSIAISAFEQIVKERKNSFCHCNNMNSMPKTLAMIQTFCQLPRRDLLELVRCIDLNNKSILQHKYSLEELRWRIEGPFDSKYSLSLLNRETALSLEKLGYNVALHSTDGPGDFEPDPKFLKENQIIKNIFFKSKEITDRNADVISRNLYPPRVKDMKSPVRMLHHYAWEESGFPQEWVKGFNSSLDGLTCISHHVQKIMIDNGVSIPMLVSGCGVDHWERITASNKYNIQAKKFRFIHVSSCFPRKGVECLLQAYGEKFTSSDDVSLIIKTFANPHNKIHQWLENARQNHHDYPHVIIIEEELSWSDLKALYELCNVLVAPSCAEGFGLPLAEAMLSGLPVITTAWGGQLDFCNKENSWLIDYEFETAQTHFGLFSSVWAKPDVNTLADLLYEAYSSTSKLRSAKAKAGRDSLLKNFQWSDVTKRYVGAVSSIIKLNSSHNPKIAWLSTWKTKCGIAGYSEHLISSLPNPDVVVFAPHDNINNLDADGCNCVRCWDISKEYNGLSQVSQEIKIRSLNTIVIQFNYGFYNHLELSRFIDENIALGLKIIVVLHSTEDPEIDPPDYNLKLQSLLPALKRCDRILVHSVADLNRLKIIGLTANVALFPHGIMNYTGTTHSVKKNRLPLIASYGFCLPHKGLTELVDAVAILRNQGTPVRLRMVNAEYPAAESAVLVKEINAHIKNLNLDDFIELNSQYLKDSESLELLSAADLIVFNYQKTGESSSAAARYGLATKRPVAVTPLPIFNDLSDAVFHFSGTDAKSTASGIAKNLKMIFSNSEEALRIQEKAEKWRKEYDFQVIGQRLHGICSALLQTPLTPQTL